MDVPVAVREPAVVGEGALACLSALASTSEELGVRVGQYFQSAGSGQRSAYPEREMPLERRLVLVEQICGAIRALSRDGNLFRRLEARALYDEGLTMAQLAGVFGVSRQRVSMLLRDGESGPAGHGGVEEL